MANTTELIFKIKADNKDLKAVMAQVRADLSQTAKQVTQQNKQEVQSAVALQRQRSAAIIAVWKGDTRAALSEERQRMQAAISLQKQRSAAVVSQWKAEQRDALRITRETEAARVANFKAGLVAVSAIATATIAATVGILKLARDTATFGARLHDLSQQTGISVGMLSTLKVAADTSGSSIEAGTAALARYLRTVSEANAGNEELRKKFIQVGFSQKDLTEAHKSSDAAIQILIDRIGSLGSDQDRLNALQKVGVRNGQELNGIIKEMDGTFAEFQKRVAAMGLVITPEQAKQAEQFDDSLKHLELTTKGLLYTFGREFVPGLTDGMNEIKRQLLSNTGTWSFWAQQIRTEIIGIKSAYAGLSAFLAVVAASGSPAAPGVGLIAAQAAFAAKNRELKSLAGLVTAGVTGVGPKRRGLGEDTGAGTARKSAASAVHQAALKEAALVEREALAILEEHTAANKRELDQQIQDIESFTKRAIELADARLNAAIDRINQEAEADTAALNKKLLTRQEFELRDRELTLRTKELTDKNTDETLALEADRDRKISAARLAAKQREIEIAEDADQRQIDRVKERIDRGVLFESQGERQIAAIVAEGLERRKKALEEESDAYSTSLERRREITDELIRLDGKRAESAEQAAQRIRDAQLKENFEAGEMGPVEIGQTILSPEDYAKLGPPPEAFAGWAIL